MAPHGVFRSKGEDRWVSISIRNDQDWARFCKVTGNEGLISDPRFATLELRKDHEPELEDLVTAWTQERTAEEATEVLQMADVAAYPSVDAIDMVNSSHVGARDFFVELEHPEVGKRRHMGIPWKLSMTPCEVQRPAPCLGQDTDAVLSEIAGLSCDEIEALRQRDILT